MQNHSNKEQETKDDTEEDNQENKPIKRLCMSYKFKFQN